MVWWWRWERRRFLGWGGKEGEGGQTSNSIWREEGRGGKLDSSVHWKRAEAAAAVGLLIWKEKEGEGRK